MHNKIRRIIPIILILALLAAALWFLVDRSRGDETLSASGAIEAEQVRLTAEQAGRVTAVLVAEGQAVTAGQELARQDDALLRAQRGQAAAVLFAAESSLALLQSGASAEQLAVAQALVDQAQQAVDAADDAYDAIPAEWRDMPDGRAARARYDQALAALALAQAQYNLAAAAPRTQQVDTARAQVDSARAALETIDVQIAKLTLTSPIDGVVLSRAINPGEFAAPGGTLLVLGALDKLTLTVYVPEDRYGEIALGGIYPVSVDSFPGQTFRAQVISIADQAEFTPRNVQTAEGRASTVFAVHLTLLDGLDQLKPGMPADVTFTALE